MNVEWRNAGELRLDSSTKPASRGLLLMMLNTLRTYGFGPPLVIDQRDTVLQGRIRIQLARELGWETVPVQVTSPKPQVASSFAELFVSEGFTDAS